MSKKNDLTFALSIISLFVADTKKNTVWRCESEQPQIFRDFEGFIANSYKSLSKTVLLSEPELAAAVDAVKNEINSFKNASDTVSLYVFEVEKYLEILSYYDMLNDFADTEAVENEDEFRETMPLKCLEFVHSEIGRAHV